MRLPLGKNKTRPAARRVPAGLSAAYSPNPESGSPEGLLKLTHPSNIWCYNLIQESNYQMYPSNTEKKEKVPNQQQPETQAVSFTLKTAQLVSCLVCRPPSHLLHFSHHTVIRERFAHRMCQWLVLPPLFGEMYLFSLEQGGTTENELSPWEGHKC